MAQFDIFGNPGRSRESVPFIVSLQNARYDAATTHFVAPLLSRSAISLDMPWLTPVFTVLGRSVVLDVFNLTTLPAARLGTPIASLAHEASRAKLLRALDEFLSQA